MIAATVGRPGASLAGVAPPRAPAYRGARAWRARGGLRSALFAALALSAGGAAPVSAAPVVILLSMDGTRWDYPERDVLPGFARMARDGGLAESLLPVFPSSTLPSHASIATGTYPDRHGIVGNRFIIPGGGFFEKHGGEPLLEAEPLWVAARRQGLRVAVFYWPLAELPWHGVEPSYQRKPFSLDLPETAKVDQILGWLDLPEPKRPSLIVSWWQGPDDAGHAHGPDAKQTRASMRVQDAQLVRLIDGIDARGRWDETTLLVVSDHGMIAPRSAVDARALLARAGVSGDAVNASGLAFIYLADPSQAPAAARKLAALDPRVRAYTREELPRQLRIAHPNAGDVVLLCDPPLAFLKTWQSRNLRRRVAPLFGGETGEHGYDPEQNSEMRGVFFALGRGVPSGSRLGRVRAIDVAATVTRLLGVAAPAQSEGAPIAGIAPLDGATAPAR